MNGQIIRLDTEGKKYLVKGQLDCCLMSPGDEGRDVRGGPLSQNEPQSHYNLSENFVDVLSGALIFFPEGGF